ncbi:MAG: AAA family ATPase [Myroides sp.]|nr:AAA family ATPase [Myroides sp.]
MSHVRIQTLSIENYRSFGDVQEFVFPNSDYLKPVSIIGYNNAGKSNFLNALLYGIGEKFISAKTFELSDLHNLDLDNHIHIKTTIDASDFAPQNQWGHRQTLGGQYHIYTSIENDELKSNCDPSFFGKGKHYNIFYINFHNIKEEISTQKTSWGNLKSFLAKHIQRLVDSDGTMKAKKDDFETEVKKATDKVLDNSQLKQFIETIQKNYHQNLRSNSCYVDFGLPNYEDIFLKMMFKVGLNGNSENLIPIDHFGDGFISMFVMAVIQAIAETNTDDRCLFLFEEPESFLHENHQEYFYKMVLCTLAEKGHQVIYTTHSDKMIDAFDTKGIIRLDTDENNQTIKAYNNVGNFINPLSGLNPIDFDEPINVTRFNEYIKTVEPNLNRMLFSKKVILVEGPNDVLVYKEVIRRKVLEGIATRTDIVDKNKFANTYLNFENISFVCHHGKATALYIVELCKHFQIDYFLINDWDFELADISIVQIRGFADLTSLQADPIYTGADRTKKGMLTTNRNLIESTIIDRIHFNVKKLETVIDYQSDDKSGLKIWNLIQNPAFLITDALFPNNLALFIGINNLYPDNQIENIEVPQDDELPF